jgi:hypothetical protein
MALRTTLDEIVEMVRNEAEISTDATRGLDHIQYIRQLVRRHYATLLDDFDWKHLILKREDCTKTIAIGQRYYDWPVTLNPNKITTVWYLWGNQWCPLQEGISFEQYNARNSELDERSDPADRWAWYGHEQFEVWPIPASLGGKVGFTGQKKGEILVNGGNRADLDDIMIALYAAGEMLLKTNEEAGQAKIAQANQRRGRMIVSSAVNSRSTMGGTDPKTMPTHHGIRIDYIRKSG